MRIRWAPAAAADLEHIKDYLDEHNPHLAQPTVRRLYATICSLRTLPRRGREGSEQNTRELICTPLPYIVVYRVTDESVQILHIKHTSQDWP